MSDEKRDVTPGYDVTLSTPPNIPWGNCRDVTDVTCAPPLLAWVSTTFSGLPLLLLLRALSAPTLLQSCVDTVSTNKSPVWGLRSNEQTTILAAATETLRISQGQLAGRAVTGTGIGSSTTSLCLVFLSFSSPALEV